MDIQEISVEVAREKLGNEEVVFIDIRDENSFQEKSIQSAIHISDANVEDFINTADKAKTYILYCYLGNSSQGAAAHFQEHGFASVYSMAGGFIAWDV